MRPRFLAGVLLLAGCGAGRAPEPAPAAARPSILLVTLDTTRADSIGPGVADVETPSFDALVARGRRFLQAYAAVPETLPSHASLMTGLYPAGHGVHENARALAPTQPLLAERLQQAGYRTAAFVSSFVLARRFGIARGFERYDDELPQGGVERSARETTERALAYLGSAPMQPLFLWVHYFDAHAPYAPPEPFRSRYAGRPYLGEIAAVDEQLGRLVQAFEAHASSARAIVIVADHGEGLGDHGEPQHGNLLYQSTMHVPLLIVGPGVAAGASDAPVSTRRVFHTILDFAGQDAANSLRGDASEVVLGEAMKPFLSYGWQPQRMAVLGRHKAILAGKTEVYDVVADPGEARDLGDQELSRPVRTALRDYPLPSPGAARAADSLGAEDRRKLASLGYVSAGAAPVVREDAPRPADQARLFELLEKASGLFVAERYAEAVPLLQRLLAADPHNLDAALRLATAHSALGHAKEADAFFDKALQIAPDSQDVRTYRALHEARGPRWQEALPQLEKSLAEAPERLPVLEALALVRERQARARDAIALWQQIHLLRAASAPELVRVGQLAMGVEDTPLATKSFEEARAMQGAAFEHDLELGVLALAARRLEDARAALDRVPRSHPAYAMALFKRAQVSVLLREPDQAARIDAARRHADATTRPLIERERLFGSGR